MHLLLLCCVVLLSSQALITRAVVEPMLSHLELPLSYGQPSQALTLQYTIHGSKHIARIDTIQHEIHYTLLASIQSAWNTLYIARIDTSQHDSARIGTLQHDNLLRRLTILQDNLLFLFPVCDQQF